MFTTIASDDSLCQLCRNDVQAMQAFDSLLKKLKTQNVATQQILIHPILASFKTINETESVSSVLTGLTAAQLAVQQAPLNADALVQLRKVVGTGYTATNLAVQARLEEKYIKQTCRKVIKVGNEDFEKVYVNVWGMTTKSDVEGCNTYKTEVAALGVPTQPTHQTTKDPAELFKHAALTFSNFIEIVCALSEKVQGVQLFLPPNLKKMGRIIEKTILKRKDDPGNANQVCDIVRGMITCDNMSQIADIVSHIGACTEIVVTRVKDRFFDAPSAGGWRDCMINFYLTADPHRHICEIQLVHTQMMTARKGLPGHAVYNRVRNASELLFMFDREQPKNKQELQQWLLQYQKGDKTTHGHPNTWDNRNVYPFLY